MLDAAGAQARLRDVRPALSSSVHAAALQVDQVADWGRRLAAA
jgi:hypothetical protein